MLWTCLSSRWGGSGRAAAAAALLVAGMAALPTTAPAGAAGRWAAGRAGLAAAGLAGPAQAERQPLRCSAWLEQPEPCTPRNRLAQDLNYDDSGMRESSKRAKVMAHGQAIGFDMSEAGSVQLLSQDSTTLSVQQFANMGLPAFRLLSVDGGHSYETTISDMRLAACSIHEGGVFVVVRCRGRCAAPPACPACSACTCAGSGGPAVCVALVDP